MKPKKPRSTKATPRGTHRKARHTMNSLTKSGNSKERKRPPAWYLKELKSRSKKVCLIYFYRGGLCEQWIYPSEVKGGVRCDAMTRQKQAMVAAHIETMFKAPRSGRRSK